MNALERHDYTQNTTSLCRRGQCASELRRMHKIFASPNNYGDIANPTGTGKLSLTFYPSLLALILSSEINERTISQAKFNAASWEPFKSATVFPRPLKSAITTIPSAATSASDDRNVTARRFTSQPLREASPNERRL